MTNPTCCCCFSLRTAALLQIVANIIFNMFSLCSSTRRAWDAYNAGDFQLSSLRVMPFVCLAMLIFGFIGAWKRKADYIRISALFELTMFIYHAGDLLYYFMTMNVGDLCKEHYADKTKDAYDIASMEQFCESPLFFYFFIIVFVCTMGPMITLDLILVITLYRYALFITNQEYSEQQRYAFSNEKTEGVSSASLTTRIFLRKRTNQSIADNQASQVTV